MAGYTAPLPARSGGLQFSRLSPEEIRKISVLRINASPALDSMLGPVPRGLYDPAMGAVPALDMACSTCKLMGSQCQGHCGHIDLPVPCYHPQFIDTTLRLLRSKCVYCHRLRVPSLHINKTSCELRLLQYGLINAYFEFQEIPAGSKRHRVQEEEAADEEEDAGDLMARRSEFVEQKIEEAARAEDSDPTAFTRNPTAASARRRVVAEFIQRASTDKKCAHCRGISPPYRKDRAVKFFKKPLSTKSRETMRVEGMKAPNPLLVLRAQQRRKEEIRKPMSKGIQNKDSEMEEAIHGAEDEIAAQDALDEAEGNLEIDDNEEVQTYMTTDEVFAALTLLFEREQEIFRLLFSKGRKTPVTADMFFIRAILVPPNKFRPPARQGADRIVEATQNGALNRIIKAVTEVRRAVRTFNTAEDAEDRGRAFARKVALAVSLQESVNGLIDQPTSTAARQAEPGIKQVFEKKEGLFRMHMMGKRVNHAARSVISPDPNIETNEIGVPLVFAKRLTFPEPVTKHNFEELKRAVMNGMDKYPGASAIEDEAGRVMSLKRKNPDQRRALAMQLLTTTIPGARGDQTKKVWRHLLSGDFVIMNRQPTLHKPSMMGHRAKVLTNQKTIRMHYANCNTYNADFDGDEMNMHFPQNELARAEASQIADTDNQYLSATAGKPLRGLIQDHISMAVQFTSRDTYFDRDQYQELIYSCLRPEDNHTIFERIQMVPPAIVKPKMLWTGKQVITTVLKNIIQIHFEGLNLTSKSSTASDSWTEITVNEPGQFKVTREKSFFRDTEQIVIFKHGEYLCGILDKGQIGPAAGGFIHSVHELYGHIIAGKLLSILGRLLTRFLNERAWSCGMDDLYLTNEGDNNRRAELSKSKRLGREVAAEYVSLRPSQAEHDPSALSGRLEGVLRDDDQLNGLDQVYKSKVKTITDNISKLCMPAGLRKSFPRNQMQAMTISGAKGSSVNANLISCNLGQQVLEGRRVPLMVSGKSLPSFAPFETDPGAGGYVKGRFLTGIKPHEYFFHAMSGREGLIDTAVKTAKSGYLQRCVIKGLEGAKAEYDSSVRESSNGTVIQFLYGEDGLEVAKQRHLKEFSFLVSNINTVGTRLRLMELAPRLKKRDAGDEQKAVLKSLRKSPSLDPILATRPPATWFGSTSETFAADLQKYMKDNPDHLIKDKAHTEATINKKTVQSVMDLKYMRSLVEAGEAIGVVAAQSVGEPSTQMTLNTFHLAGHSAKNVTLGIPRLREIVMTATSKIMTPTMTIRPIEELTLEEGHNFAKGITKLPLTHMISELKLKERNDTGQVYKDGRVYDVTIQFFDREEYQEEYHIKSEDVRKALIHKFLPRLHNTIKNLLKKKIKEADRSEATAAVPELGVSVGRVEEQRAQGARREREGGEDFIDEEADPESAKDTAGRERAEDNYDEPDDDDQRIEDAPDTKDDDDDEDNEDDAAAKKAKKAKEAAEAAETAAEDSGYESDSLAPKTEEEKEELAIIQELNPQVAAFNFDRDGNDPTRILLKYPTKTPKLLLLPILESCLHQSVVHSIPGLNTCTLFMEDVVDSAGKKVRIINADNGQEEDKKEPVITTEGVNLLAMRDYQHAINPNTIYTNSVHDMLNSYGIEAARAVIIREISTVFAGHGISVDNRHINLIADAMTQTGKYLAFSRNGIVKESSSVLARMSFESGMVVLKDAVLEEARDDLKGVSAGIVAGRRGVVGTGGVDIVLPVS